jgi:hypothetical protein
LSIFPDNTNDIKQFENSIYINLYYSENFKFNNNNVIFDQTDDIKKFRNNKNDSTDDIIKKNHLVYKKDDIDLINKSKIVMTDELIKYLDVYLKEKKIYANIIKYVNDLTDDKSIIFDIKVNNYNPGEYNLIKNKPSYVIFESSYKKNILDKIYKKAFIKKYKQKALIDFPIEEKST